MNKIYRILFSICVLCSEFALLEAATFYVKPTGNDASNGLSIPGAWQSITKLNTATFSAGDTILFEGGATFNGNIYLSAASYGTLKKPILVGSYGSGKATIKAGNGHGFFAYNNSGIEVKNLIFSGAGYTVNTGIGVHFFMDKPGNTRLKHVVLENLEVSGFKTSGIQIGSWPTDQSRSGYDSVSIRNCLSHDNGLSGISMYGYYNTSDTLYSHKNLLVSRCKVFNNHGILGMSTHSGSGIVIGQVDSCVMEYCEAYENGKNNNYAGGGPAGIWAWDSKNTIIQYCYAHHNRSQTGDGDGFDLDGGVRNSIMQYNYAHDNDGPGFLVAQYTGARKMKNIAVRYNISERDGKGLGALIWSGDTAGLVTAEKIDFYNNTVFIDTIGSNIANAAIAVYSNYGAIKDIRICNNIFLTKNNAPLVDIYKTMNLNFFNNAYYDYGNGYKFIDKGVSYNSMITWRSVSGQEIYKSKNTGFRIDPELLNAGGGNRIAGVDSLKTLKAYRLKNKSILIGKGIVIDSLLFFTNIVTDFFGDTIKINDQYSPGAHEIDAPEAQFSVSNTCKGIITKFINRSLKAKSYLWKFGDGSSSSLISPTHQYSIAGKYSVTLIVTGKFGYIDSIKKIFEIYALPTPDFNTGNNFCQYSMLTFNNTGPGAASQVWHFDDSTSDTKQPTAHIFKYPGKHQIKLVTISAQGCKDSITKQVEIHKKPLAFFSAINSCADDSLPFKNLSNGDSLYQWNFGDSSFSTLKNPGHLYKYPGKYFAQLIVTSGYFCSDTFDVPVKVYKKPTALFKTNDHCFGDAIPLQNLSTNDSLSFWDFGEGTTSSTKAPFIICKLSGKVIVKLKVMSVNGCFDSTKNPVEIFKLPSAQFTYMKNNDSFYLKANDTLLDKYQWYVNDTLLNSKLPKTNIKFTRNGTQKILLKTISVNNCSDTFSILITNSLSINHRDIPPDPQINAYPNPFSGNLIIQFRLSKESPISLIIADMQGREVYKFIIRETNPGINIFTMDTMEYPLSSGIYHLELEVNRQTFTKKLIKE